MQLYEGWLNLFTSSANIGQYLLDTFFVDYTHTLTGHTQTYKTLFTLQPKTVLVQIRQKPSSSSVFGVGYIISRYRPLTGDLTYSGHFQSLPLFGNIWLLSRIETHV
jgi:hypothetical protein